MFNKIKEKAGNEILQVIVIVAILGAVTVTVCYALSTQLRKSTGSAITVLKEGTENIYNTTNTTP